MLQCEDLALRNEEIIINIKAFMGYRLFQILVFAFGYSMFELTRHSLRHAETFVFDRSPPLSNSWQNYVYGMKKSP
jgi:hypothetical protein